MDPAFRPRRARVFGALALLAVGALALALLGQGIARLIDPPAAVGEPAPPFSVEGLDGAAVTRPPGRVALLDFGVTTCAGCVVATTKLNRLHDRYGPRGLFVLSTFVQPGERAEVASFVARREVRYPVALDDGAVSESFGAFKFPTIVLIDREGRIRSRRTGAIAEVTLEREIEALLDSP